ncbi:MAG: hypothetical protein J7D60_09395 [Prosthecochloris sp.]|nr:hypothetical protein [Prosthecochloris sp.]
MQTNTAEEKRSIMILGEKCSTERQQPDLFDKVTQTAEEKFTDLVYVGGTKKTIVFLDSIFGMRYYIRCFS